jgi:hypothetical protein
VRLISSVDPANSNGSAPCATRGRQVVPWGCGSHGCADQQNSMLRHSCPKLAITAPSSAITSDPRTLMVCPCCGPAAHCYSLPSYYYG